MSPTTTEWNELPTEIKQGQNSQTFKKKGKPMLFDDISR